MQIQHVRGVSGRHDSSVDGTVILLHKSWGQAEAGAFLWIVHVVLVLSLPATIKKDENDNVNCL